MAKTDSRFEARLAAAVLRVASTRAWADVTMEQVARAAKMPVAQLGKRYPRKEDLLPLLVRFITKEAQAAIGPQTSGTPRDRLFEILMGRFDVLQKHRPAILGIMRTARWNISSACVLLTAQRQAIRDMWPLVETTRAGVKRQAVITAALGVYLAAAAVWARDESLDMSKTMAALDRYLRRAEQSMEIIARFGG